MRTKTFLQKKAYTQVTEPDTDGVTQLHKLKFTRPIPNSWDNTAVEAIEAFRATLDQAGYVSAVLSGKTNPKNTYFPIATDPAGLKDVIKRGRCKDLPEEILALFLSFKPYKGGNDALWVLNQLCNAGKHRVIAPIVIAPGGMVIRRAMMKGPGAILFPRWDSEKNEIIFAKTGPGGRFEYNLKLKVFVAFANVDALRGQPAVGVLNAIGGEVQRVLRATEAECRRIGLLPSR